MDQRSDGSENCASVTRLLGSARINSGTADAAAGPNPSRALTAAVHLSRGSARTSSVKAATTWPADSVLGAIRPSAAMARRSGAQFERSDLAGSRRFSWAVAIRAGIAARSLGAEFLEHQAGQTPASIGLAGPGPRSSPARRPP